MPPGDHGDEMTPAWQLDDDTIEAVVAGDEVDARFDQLVAFARHVEGLGEGTPPPVSPALEAVFAGPPPDGRRSRSRPGRLTATTARLAGLGVAARVGLGTAVASVALVGAGAAGVLPAQATARVRGAIEVVTPVDFGDDDHTPDTTTGGDPASPGDRVPGGATGESDRLPGAGGGDVSGESPGSGSRPAGRGDETDGERDRPRDTRQPGAGGSPGAGEADRSGGTPGGPPDGVPGRPDDRGGGDRGGGDEADGRADAPPGDGQGRDDAPGQGRRPTTTATTAAARSAPPVPGQGQVAEEDD